MVGGKRKLPYIIGEKLGSGSFGRVYVGKHPKTGKRVALKIFKDKDDETIKIERKNNETVRKLFRQRGFLNRGTYENIIVFLGAYVLLDGKSPVFAFEYAEGGDVLHHLLEKGTFSEAYTRDIVRGVLRGLDRLHECRIMHRDIKPENILLKKSSSPSSAALSDFGVSAHLKNGGAKEFNGGTIAFSPPEAFYFGLVGRKGDIWGLGAVMHELLLGTLPFGTRQTSPKILIEKVLTARIDFNNKKYKKISLDCRDLMKKLLTKNPNYRPTAYEALRHPWFDNAPAAETFTAANLTGITMQRALLRIDAVVSFLDKRMGKERRMKLPIPRRQIFSVHKLVDMRKKSRPAVAHASGIPKDETRAVKRIVEGRRPGYSKELPREKRPQMKQMRPDRNEPSIRPSAKPRTRMSRRSR